MLSARCVESLVPFSFDYGSRDVEDLQVKGMQARTMKAGRASPMKSQLILVAFSIIMAPTTIKTDPVAHEGMLLRMGAKKMLTKNQKLVAMAVNPVFPPSAIPLADSACVETYYNQRVV